MRGDPRVDKVAYATLSSLRVNFFLYSLADGFWFVWL